MISAEWRELLVSLSLGLSCVLGLGISFIIFYNPLSTRRRSIKRQSYQDYKQARGTAHLHLLQNAERQIIQAQTVCIQTINAAKQRHQSLQQTQRHQLEKQLTQWLVTERLQEVPGIGEKRQMLISRSVFRGDLRDLHKAHMIHGISQNIQQEINAWIRHCESQWSTLMEHNFPGKVAILRQYRPRLKQQEQIIKAQQAELDKLDAKKARLEKEVVWLKNIKPADFVQARSKPQYKTEEIAAYIQGIFAEWEPMPDWFQDIITTYSMPAEKDSSFLSSQI